MLGNFGVQELTDDCTIYGAVRDKVVRVDRLPTQRECFQAFGSFPSVGEWSAFCEANGTYQIVHQELIEDVSSVLDRIVTPQVPILEVGAGRGKLSYWLSKQGFATNPVDDLSWGNVAPSPYVEPLRHDHALEKYSPEVVIGGWIQTSSTIVHDVLACDSVRHFLHLGNPGFAAFRRDAFLRKYGIKYAEVPIRASPAYCAHKAENLGLYSKN